MKLRSLLFVAALAGVVSAADVGSSSQTIASLAVPATGTYTLLAVPFKDVGGATDAVKVKDLVKTIGLKANSKLYYYDGSGYYVWNLDDDGGAWQGVTITKMVDGKSITVNTPDTNKTVARGATIWLERASGSDQSAVLYGEEGAEISTTITASSMQLISNPKETDKTVSEAGTAGDMIMIPNDGGTQVIYKYNGETWGKEVTSTITIGGKDFPTTTFDSTQKPVIPGGRGAWYVSKGSTVPTIAW